MENNIKVSRAHRILAVFYGIIDALFIVLAIVSFTSSSAREKDDWILLIYPVLLTALTVLHSYAAKGAFVENNTARVVSMVIGGLMILGFPIGTVIGIYLLTNSQSWNTPTPVTPSTTSPSDSSVWPPPPTSPSA